MFRGREGSSGLLEDYGLLGFGILFVLAGLAMILEFTTNISLQVMGFAIVIIGCVCIIFGAVGSSVDAISLLINKKLK